MMEWVLILTLWTGETVIYDTWQNEEGCHARVVSLITRDSTETFYGPPRYMNIYCEAVDPGEPIVEWWKLCAWREGCWGPDTVNWSSIPPTRPGWYLHRYGPGKAGDLHWWLLKLEERNGFLVIAGSGATWREMLPRFPVASLAGEWTQDALAMRDEEQP